MSALDPDATVIGRVQETLLVLVIVVSLVGASLLVPLVTSMSIVVAGTVCMLLGLLLGIPTGFYYHVKLHAVLAPRGVLPERWWLRPTAFHAHLDERERERVMPWFYAGGAGFALILLGCGVALLGLWTAA